MKRVTLREDRAPYLVNEEILSDEPVIVERNGQAVAAVIPIADYEAFLAWRATLDEPWPGEPPRTPEGDLEALAAVERIRTMFPPVDAETVRLLTSPGQFLLDYRLALEEERNVLLDFLPSHSRVFCDANVLTYAFLGVDETSQVCSALLKRSASREIDLYTRLLR